MRRKTKYIVGNKIYIIGEPTVGLYWLSILDIEQFLEELFLEFNDVIPKLNKDQINVLIENLFEIKEEIFENILNKNKKEDLNKIKDFHIVVGQFMKFYPGNSFQDTMNIPFNIFNKLLIDSKIISGEKEYNPNWNGDKPEKEKLRNLVNNFN